MLALTRRPGETIHIGPDIVLHVVTCDRGRVKVSLDAPREVKIVRGELNQRKKAPAATPA